MSDKVKKPKPFGFGLDESAALARKLIEQYGAPCAHFDVVVESWKRNKWPLIEAIDAKTGRISCDLSTVVKPSKEESLVAFRAALNAAGLGSWGSYITPADMVDEKVADPQCLIRLANGTCKITKGMKLSKALTGILIKCSGYDETAASAMVTKIWDAFNSSAGGTAVLSANILDILQASHSCSYSSCHRPDGEHRGGPQQYLHDGFTAVAYIFRDTRPIKIGDESPCLPYKTWRQLIHISLADKFAIFMRHYPAAPPKAHLQALHQMVATLLGEGTYRETSEVGGLIRFSEARHLPLAYVDSPTLGIYLAKPPGRLVLPSTIPCSGCGRTIGHEDHWSSADLVCTRCANGSIICAVCGNLIGDCKPIKMRGDARVCQECFASVCQRCSNCGLAAKRSSMTAYAGGSYCEHCSTSLFMTCANCTATVLRKDCVTNVRLCQKCYKTKYVDCGLCGTACAIHKAVMRRVPHCSAIVDVPLCPACALISWCAVCGGESHSPHNNPVPVCRGCVRRRHLADATASQLY